MKITLSKAEKILLLSICFTVVLLVARMWHTHTPTYSFYIWNLFLAVIPIWVSRQLAKHATVGFKSVVLISGWLLFFPNAPYVITDIFHFYQRPEMPFWYDLLLVFSATWNGMVAGFISLIQVDKFIALHTGRKVHAVLMTVFVFAASCGVYLGRFLRFNSWDIVRKPRSLAEVVFYYTFQPLSHIKAWAFSVLCTVLLLLIYHTIKSMSGLVTEPIRKNA